MTVLLAQVYDEALRVAYALSNRDLGDLVVDAGLVALIAAFGMTAWRLKNAPRAQRRDHAWHS
jgi:hypothetical protein